MVSNTFVHHLLCFQTVFDRYSAALFNKRKQMYSFFGILTNRRYRCSDIRRALSLPFFSTSDLDKQSLSHSSFNNQNTHVEVYLPVKEQLLLIAANSIVPVTVL